MEVLYTATLLYASGVRIGSHSATPVSARIVGSERRCLVVEMGERAPILELHDPMLQRFEAGVLEFTGFVLVDGVRFFQRVVLQPVEVRKP